MQCQNNLKQISLGVLHYENKWAMLPIDIPEDPCGDTKVVATGVSWMVRLLPYIEQQGLYDSMKIDGPVANGQGIITNDPLTRTGNRHGGAHLLLSQRYGTGKSRTTVGTKRASLPASRSPSR